MRWISLLAATVACVAAHGTRADDSTTPIILQAHDRPEIHLNRWQEDWSVLADPALRTEPLDNLKYIPLSSGDLDQAFIAYSSDFAGGKLKVRVGRQQMAFDLQRFVGVRDGPNVRQSFDAIWADWEKSAWRFIGFLESSARACECKRAITEVRSLASY